MAAIPTIVHIGNGELNGATPKPVVTILDSWLIWLNQTEKKYAWAIPADASTGLLAAVPGYFPWYDHTYGDWVPYFHVPNFLAAPWNTTNGDNTSAPGLGGFGASVAYMQRFNEYYAASPYFKAIKSAYPGGIVDKWNITTGTSYATFVTKFANAVTAAAPDTLDVKLIIIDASGFNDGDIKNWGTAAATYQDDLTDLIAELRSTLPGASNALVILISHPTSYQATSGGVGAFAVQQIHFELAQTLDDVRIVQMQEEDLGNSTGIYGSLVPGADQFTYNAYAYLRQGEDIYSTFIRSLSAAPASNNSSIPFFLHIGDSQAVGTLSAVLISQLLSTELIGPRDNEYIYNAINVALEKIQPGVNCNTCGTISTTCGSFLTLTEKLHEKHPDGYVIMHMAKSGSAVSGTGLLSHTAFVGGRWSKKCDENYPELQTFMASIMNATLTQTGTVQVQKVPVLHGIFIELGDNDCNNEFSASIFRNELMQLIRDLRNDFGMSLWGLEVPVVLVRPHSGSALGDATARITVREAFDYIKANMNLVDYVDMDDLGFAIDGIHYGAQTHIAGGYRMYETYADLIASMVPSP